MPPRIELLGPQPALPNQVSGVIATLDGMTLTLRRRDGTLAFIEFLAAAKSPDFPPIGSGKSITAIGTTDAQGILHAKIIIRTTAAKAFWPNDQ